MSKFKDVNVHDYQSAKQFAYDELGVIIEPSADMVKDMGGYEIKTLSNAKYGKFKVVSNLKGLKAHMDLQVKVLGFIHSKIDDEATEEEKEAHINVDDYAQILEAAFIPNWSKPTDSSVKLSRMLLIKDSGLKKKLAPSPIEGYNGSELPVAYVPSTESLNPVLRDLEIGDLLTILPEAEQGALALAIGRGLTGINGEVHCHTGYKVKTDWRWMVALSGAPGIGKTCLMETMLEAAEELGYSKATFVDISGRFGQGSIVSKDFAYCDDLTTKSLGRLISDDIFKILITSGTLRVEEKFQAKSEVQARSLILANINKFDSSVLHSLDEGALDRLLVIQTHSPYNLVKQEGIELPKLSKGSPHLGTAQHFEWLRETYGVTTQELYNAFFRRCVDYYLSEINAGTLKNTVNYLKSFFKFTLPANIHGNFCKLLQIAIVSTTDKERPEYFTAMSFAEGLIALNFFMNSKECNEMRNHLKAHWVTQGRISNHPWCIFKAIDEKPVCDAANDCLTIDKKEMLKTDVIIKRLLTYIRLTDGFKVNCSLREITTAWDDAQSYVNNEFSNYFSKINKVMYKDNKDFDISHLYTTKTRQEISDEVNK